MNAMDSVQGLCGWWWKVCAPEHWWSYLSEVCFHWFSFGLLWAAWVLCWFGAVVCWMKAGAKSNGLAGV